MRKIRVLDINEMLAVIYTEYHCKTEAIVEIGKRRLKVPYFYTQKEDKDNRHIGTEFEAIEFEEIRDMDDNIIKELSQAESVRLEEAISKAVGG
jgi:hypothetical protein